MLHELDALEAYWIAELAAEARKLRERLLEKVPPTALGEPKPTRGERDPARNVLLDDVLNDKLEFVALQDAITALPREIRQSIWAVMEIGRGRFSARQWDQAVLQAAALEDAEIVATLMDEPDLHDCLCKGLYALGMVPPSGIG